MKLLCSIVRTSVARIRLWCLVPLVWMVVIVVVLPVRAQMTTYTVPEAAEANKLYTSTNGASWKNKQGWPLQMTYTTTATTKPSATGVGFSGSEPQLLIQWLSLSSNQLSGSIPNFSLPNLQVLYLYNNQLSGSIPNFSLPNLRELYFDKNQLSGGIPNFSLPNLQELWLSSNQLSGGIPNFSLSNLRTLYLDNNQLSGGIPNFSLPNLRTLYLDNNQLSGGIPNFSLPNLQDLRLSGNQLSGGIPNFNLPNLQDLRLSGNQLSGGIPNFNLPNLQVLWLSNNQLSGSIPNFSLPNLQELWLSTNQLSGGIPNFSLPNLQVLFLSTNQLSGGIPSFSLPNLRRLWLSSNQLSGGIPNFSLPNLQELWLSTNQLSGSIPNFSLPNLQVLGLSANQLNGNIPNFSLPNLQQLYLSSNRLSGTIPNFNLPNLQRLFLSNNQLSDSDMDWAEVPKLTHLRLEGNKLVFRDLEPAAKAMQGRAGSVFSYSPQDSVAMPISGDTVRMDVGGERTQYQWYRNGEAIANATQAFYKTTDTALYFCRATNTLLPDLILTSLPIQGGSVITLVTALNIRPNPFWEHGSISYSLTRRLPVSIAVYSLLGQKLLTVFEGEQSAGTHVQELAMSAFSIGVYLVRVQAGDGVQSAFVHYVR